MYYPDISHYHPVEDWSKAKSFPFIISKATEGTSFIDSTLDDFIKGCEANGISYWLYAYLSKGNEKAQAKYLYDTCKGKVGSRFVGYALDVEAGNTATDVQTALDYLVSVCDKQMLYTGYSKYDKYKDVLVNRPSTCAWWEARYGANDGTDTSAKYPCHDGVDLHQFTSMGTANGITGGKCDLNRLTGTKAESWFTAAGLSVDGSIGAKTVTKLQQTLGTTVDGKISGQTSDGKKYWTSVSDSVCSWSGGSSQVVKALQKLVGATQDGVLGTKTAKATQTYLIGKGFSCGSKGADGYFGTESAKALQNWLNTQ